AREPERRLVRVGPVEYHVAADGLDHRRAVEAGGQRVARLLRGFGRGFEDAHLQELAGVEGVGEGPHGGVRYAFLADVEDGFERLSESAEVSALARREGGHGAGAVGGAERYARPPASVPL